MSKKNIITHWNLSAKDYQNGAQISADVIHYGPYCPNEDELKLLGDVKGKKIIELGCGGAQNSIALAKRGAICTGVDISREQLKFAKELARLNKVEVNFIEGDLENLEMIEDDVFDIAISAIAFDWLQDFKKGFNEFYRILNHNGVIVFSIIHPFFIRLGETPKNLKIETSYFERIDNFKEPTGVSISFCIPTIGDVINNLIACNFTIEKVLEPEPVEDNANTSEDSFYKDVLGIIPTTLIIKARKKCDSK